MNKLDLNEESDEDNLSMVFIRFKLYRKIR